MKRLATGLVVILAVIAVSVHTCSAGPRSAAHSVTITVPAIDVIFLDTESVMLIIGKTDDGSGLRETQTSHKMNLSWATNGFPRMITVRAEGVPPGAYLELLRPMLGWARLSYEDQIWLADASSGKWQEYGGFRPLPIVYAAYATLEVPPGSYPVIVIYTLIGS